MTIGNYLVVAHRHAVGLLGLVITEAPEGKMFHEAKHSDWA